MKNCTCKRLSYKVPPQCTIKITPNCLGRSATEVSNNSFREPESMPHPAQENQLALSTPGTRIPYTNLS